MPSSGQANFNLSFLDLAEEAYERCGKELRTGYDLRTARRSLNLLTLEWANRGLNFWTLEEGNVPLVTGQEKYTLQSDTIDLIEHVVRQYPDDPTRQIDTPVSRLAMVNYATLPNKLIKGRPAQVAVDRQASGVSAFVWPVPANDSYQLVFWRLRRIQDAGTGPETADVPFRFLPALTAGLAYYLSFKIPGADKVGLEAEYTKQWMLAEESDRDRASFTVSPVIRKVG